MVNAWEDESFQRRDYALEMALRFVWACQRQINRFTEGFVTRPTLVWDYRKGIVAPLGTARTYDLYRSDAYLVLAAAMQSTRWLRRVDREFGVPVGTYRLDLKIKDQLETLRDIYEHWEQHLDSFRRRTRKTKAGSRFASANPDIDWPGDGWKWSRETGAVLDNLSLKELFDELTRVEALLLNARRELWLSIGLPIPNGDYVPFHLWEP